MSRQLHATRVRAVIALWEVMRAREHAWNAALDLAAGCRGTITRELEAALDRRSGEWNELLAHL